jgi:hypothetical protein
MQKTLPVVEAVSRKHRPDPSILSTGVISAHHGPVSAATGSTVDLNRSSLVISRLRKLTNGIMANPGMASTQQPTLLLLAKHDLASDQ